MSRRALRKIPVDKLVPHPIQHDWAFQPRIAKMIGANFREELCGVIDVAPLSDGTFGVFVGRHRVEGAKIAGVTELRCDVHYDLTEAEMAAIKVGKDRDRRAVKSVEGFLDAINAGEAEAVEINKIAEKGGYVIAPSNGSDNHIAAVVETVKIHRVGPNQLEQVLELNKLWKGEEGTTQKWWLRGLSEFINGGYYERLTDARRAQLQKVVPFKLIAEARAKAKGLGGGAGGVEPALLIAEQLRKKAGLRRPNPRVD